MGPKYQVNVSREPLAAGLVDWTVVDLPTLFLGTTVWQYTVQNKMMSLHWSLIKAHFTPVKAFEVRAGILTTRPGPPPPMLNAFWFAFRWGNQVYVATMARGLLTPPFCYNTTGVITPLCCTRLQLSCVISRLSNTFRLTTLSANGKHVTCIIPEDLWVKVWLSYRGAFENMFLRQVVYRIISTEHWCNPSLPATDVST